MFGWAKNRCLGLDLEVFSLGLGLESPKIAV